MANEAIRYDFVLSYCAAVPRGPATISGQLLPAIEWARSALTNDPARPHVVISTTAVCVACSGSGRKQGRRFQQSPCKACKGEGQREIASETLTRAEV